jgi:predicted Zn-dependent protease
MRFRMSFAGSALCLIGLAFPAGSQTSPGGNTTSQVSKTWEIGRSVADQLDPFVRHVEHFRLADDLGDYLQRLEDRIASRAGVKPAEIRVTEGSEWYAFLLPQGVLYISSGLLERVSSEGELAGLLAHELAHENPKVAGGRFQQCALAAGYLPVQRSPRESERLATQRAVGYLKASRYDPSAMLDLLSQVSYEYQKWSKTIASEDLLRLRVALEAEAEPVDGYVVDDSEFAKFRARLPGAKPIPLIIIRPNQ